MAICTYKDNEINKNNFNKHVIMRSKAKLLQCYYREGNSYLIKSLATMLFANRASIRPTSRTASGTHRLLYAE